VVYAIGNNTVVARATNDNSELWRINIINHELVDHQNADRIVLLAGDKDNIYAVAKHDTSDERYKRWVYAIDRGNGNLLWTSQVPLKYYTAVNIVDIMVDDDSVITVDEDGGVIKFNKSDGSYVWSNIMLGRSPYNIHSQYIPDSPLALIGDNVYAGKSIPVHVGVFSDDMLPEVHGVSHGLLQPTTDVPSDLEEYIRNCIVVSETSNQIIVPFLSTRETAYDGEHHPDEDYNNIYSFSLEDARTRGTVTSWNWRTRPFLFSNGPTGCPAMDAQHVYMVTRNNPYYPVRLIAVK